MTVEPNDIQQLRQEGESLGNAMMEVLQDLAEAGGGVPDPSGEPDGQVLTTDSGAAVWAAGGGSQAGASIVRGPFPFAFDDAGLADGIEFYTPTIGDFLLAATIFTDTIFDGTTPFADFGSNNQANAGGAGLFYTISGAVNLTQGASDPQSGGDTLTALVDNSMVGQGIVGQVGFGTNFPPYEFVTATPLMVWASQDGFQGGDPVGGAAGAARIFIVTATPEAF